MSKIESIFQVKKPIIGMLHLDYLEGKNFKGLDYIVQRALKDIKALEDGGIDGILVENWKEESIGVFVSAETADNFKEVVTKLAKHLHVPFGINVLNNDYKVAFSLVKLTKASFVELDVFVDKVKSDFQNTSKNIKIPFNIDPKPEKIWDYAKSISAEGIPLLVFIQPKHYILLEKSKTIEESTHQAIKAGASAVLVTKATGFAPTLDLIKRAKKAAGNFPVGIGSGFSAQNAAEILPHVDFAIVGTSLKIDGVTDNPVDEKKVEELMNIVNDLR